MRRHEFRETSSPVLPDNTVGQSEFAYTVDSPPRQDDRVDTILYEMPEERSIDIDTELDWRIVELLTTPAVQG